MRKIMACMIIMFFLLTACTTKNGNGQASENSQIQKTDSSGESSATPEVSETEAAESEQTAEPSTTAAVDSLNEQETGTEIGKKIKPLVSEKIDTSRQGVRMSADIELYTDMMRGDDGFCYYYRKEGKGKNKKIVFYKDNGIKVCETKMKESFEKGGYHIVSFAKYGKKFFVVLEEEYVFKTILTTVDIATGKWGKAIKDKYTYDTYIIYDNKFYCIDQGVEVTVYDLSDTQKRKKLSPGGKVQCIVDDKIYYLTGAEKDTTKIMRCNMDGKKKEKLYEYGRVGWRMMGSLQIDENYIYYVGYVVEHEKYNLIRIPLYGGKIEGVAKAGGYFEVADEYIFYFSYNPDFNNGLEEHYVYRVDKELKEKPKAVTKTYFYQYGFHAVEMAPFYYGGGHLLVPHYDWDEQKYVDLMYDDEDCWDIYIDGKTTYAPDWYRVSEDGKTKDIIKGTGVKKKWKKEYRKWN